MDNPLYTINLKNDRIKYINNVIENKLSYIDQKNILKFIINLLNVAAEIVQTNCDKKYKVLIQVKLSDLSNEDLISLEKYISKFTQRNI